MSDTLDQIKLLVLAGNIRISDHGYDELAADGILAREAVEGLVNATIVEDYPGYPKGPCVLLRQKDSAEEYIHVLWGIPKGRSEPAVLITAYRPDPEMWDNGFLKRKR
ncbi:MAG: DUF4258 domain-containing protein [Acidobacteria bacterium]|nr:DUF4258 domain-containing protein [Acidobacteriota bacterium]